MSRSNIVFAANRGYALLNSRASLISRMLDKDWNVVIATADDLESRSLRDMGAVLEPVIFSRSAKSPFADAAAYRRLLQIYRKWRPVLVQHYHAKPVILGSAAAKKIANHTIRIVNTITGLGQAFVSGGFTSYLAGIGYKASAGRADATVFQNHEDREFFLKRNWLRESQARLIVGSGVDLNRFPLIDRSQHKEEELKVVMLSRLLQRKGIPEFISVAERVKQSRSAVKFLLAGEEEPMHPDAVSLSWLKEQTCVEYLGRLSDVLPVLKQADILLFPSSYKEGTPRVILEAAATGLPVVAFDVSGVREAVEHGKTGYLAPLEDTQALTNHTLALLDDRSLRLSMGKSGRKLMERCFNMIDIEEKYLSIYRELGLEGL